MKDTVQGPFSSSLCTFHHKSCWNHKYLVCQAWLLVTWLDCQFRMIEHCIPSYWRKTDHNCYHLHSKDMLYHYINQYIHIYLVATALQISSNKTLNQICIGTCTSKSCEPPYFGFDYWSRRLQQTRVNLHPSWRLKYKIYIHDTTDYEES